MVVFWALALSGAAVAGNGGFAPVEPASPNAEGIRQSYLWVCDLHRRDLRARRRASLIWFIVRYRCRSRARTEEGAQVHGNTNLELAWTVAPVADPGRDRLVRLLQAPGDRGRRRARARRPDGSTCRSRATATTGTSRTRTASSQSTSMRAPVGQTVKLNVSAPDFDVIHSWWIPALGGKFDAIPGTTNVTWFNANAARHLPGPVRRVLRHRSTPTCGRPSKPCRARSSTPGSSGEAAPRRPERPSSARRRSPARARSVTASRARVSSARALAGKQPLADDAAVEQVVRERPRRDAAGRARLGRAPDGRAARLPPDGGAQWPLTPRRHTPAWQRGRLASWLVTTDHKRIGILYLATSGLFFLAGGVMALLMRTQLAQPNDHFLDERPLQPAS